MKKKEFLTEITEDTKRGESRHILSVNPVRSSESASE